jgi:hypothetical protein
MLSAEAVMVRSSPATIPHPGDVVVSRASDGSHRYVLSTFSEVPQVACATRDEAVAQAERFARTHRVNVWPTEDDRTFTRIIEARLASSI